MRWPDVWMCVPLALLFVPAGAEAKICGDHVRGRDIPCACGDVVVGDLALDTDPVIDSPCPNDGLIVRAAGARVGVTIDLRGHHLRGSGKGTGLRILYGGPGGAWVVSSSAPAVLEGFRDGLRASGPDSIALIDGVVVRGSRRDGVRVSGADYTIRSTEAWGSGRNGFALTGRRFRLSSTRAVNSHRFGYFVVGRNAVLGTEGAGIAAEGSGADGIFVNGTGHQLTDCTATGSGRQGVRLGGARHTVRECRAENNGASGIRGTGRDWELTNNEARGNAGRGIVVSGLAIVDGGGNRASGNRGHGNERSIDRPLREDRQAVECEISGRPCLH